MSVELASRWKVDDEGVMRMSSANESREKGVGTRGR